MNFYFIWEVVKIDDARTSYVTLEVQLGDIY